MVRRIWTLAAAVVIAVLFRWKKNNLIKRPSMALKSMALSFAFRSASFSKHACTTEISLVDVADKMLVARRVRSNQHDIAQCAIRKKQN